MMAKAKDQLTTRQTIAKKAADKKTRVTKQKKEIVERLSDGEPLAVICRREGFPASTTTVRVWMEKDCVFKDAIAQAREDGEDYMAAECLAIADDGKNDYMATQDSASYRLNGEHIQRSKLRIDTRLKLLAKWNPKKYGDKITNVHEGQLAVTGFNVEGK